jgi:hypothetical protein
MSTAVLQIERGVTAITMARQHGDPIPPSWVEALDQLVELEVSSWPWMLQQWRIASIPTWKRIRAEAESACDLDRVAYASWMLRSLLDPESLKNVPGIARPLY